MEYIGKTFTFILLMVLSALIGGYTVHTMWSWFVTPVFGIPTPGLASVIGLVFLLKYLTFRSTEEKDDREKFWSNLAKRFFTSVFIAALTLFNGWIVTLFL